MIKYYYLYLKKKQKIKSRKRNITTFMLKEIKSRMQNIVIFLKEIKFRKRRNVIISFKKSTVNENRFLNACNELITIKMMILKQSKKEKKTLFRSYKFDVLIRFI
jgi:hypothetical protein